MKQQYMRYLMNDFVVQEHVCNLRCTYCLNFENENLKDGEPWMPTERVNLKPNGFGWQRASNVLARCRDSAEAPILRVAGGEVMALPGAVEFIEQVAPEWERVQVLTNATFLARQVDRLAKIKNLNLCCSLDGHTPELNRARTPVTRWAERIIEGVFAAIDAGIPVEIYTVLTRDNAPALHEFAEHVFSLRRPSDVRLLPFPVRGEVGKAEAPTRDQLPALASILGDFERLQPILPPKRYLERLYGFWEGRVRTWRCRVPLAYQQTFDDGVVASCSNCWASPLGNILEDPSVFDQVGSATIHRLFLRDPPRFPFCRTCFTPFDVVNVYLDGECTLEELSRMDLYSSPGVRTRLAEMRRAWEGGIARPLREAIADPDLHRPNEREEHRP
jgi:MoaA/NifB/PqqE/SkfB family radical SAM enzyme